MAQTVQHIYSILLRYNSKGNSPEQWPWLETHSTCNLFDADRRASEWFGTIPCDIFDCGIGFTADCNTLHTAETLYVFRTHCRTILFVEPRGSVSSAILLLHLFQHVNLRSDSQTRRLLNVFDTCSLFTRPLCCSLAQITVYLGRQVG